MAYEALAHQTTSYVEPTIRLAKGPGVQRASGDRDGRADPQAQRRNAEVRYTRVTVCPRDFDARRRCALTAALLPERTAYWITLILKDMTKVEPIELASYRPTWRVPPIDRRGRQYGKTGSMRRCRPLRRLPLSRELRKAFGRGRSPPSLSQRQGDAVRTRRFRGEERRTET
jgi:hypothetical protein